MDLVRAQIALGPLVVAPADTVHDAVADRLVEWIPEKKAFLPIPGQPLIDFETSKGRGIRGNVPGYPCTPGTCCWKK
jgi:hypothetical protein